MKHRVLIVKVEPKTIIKWSKWTKKEVAIKYLFTDKVVVGEILRLDCGKCECLRRRRRKGWSSWCPMGYKDNLTTTVASSNSSSFCIDISAYSASAAPFLLGRATTTTDGRN